MRYFFKLLDYIEEGIMVLGVAVMVVMNFVNVVCRFLLPQTPFSYTEELTILIFEWVTMFGIAYGYKKSAHTGLSLVVDLLPKSMQKIMTVFSSLCTIILMLIIIWSSYGMLVNQITHGNVFPGLKISSAWGGAAVLAGAVMIMIRAVQVCIQKLYRKEAG